MHSYCRSVDILFEKFITSLRIILSLGKRNRASDESEFIRQVILLQSDTISSVPQTVLSVIGPGESFALCINDHNSLSLHNPVNLILRRMASNFRLNLKVQLPA